jgi:replicative DNA helicase
MVEPVSKGSSRLRGTEHLRLPPHSLEAKQSLLGGLMLDQRAWDHVADAVAAEDFYRADHRAIFAAIEALIERDQPPDAVTVSEQLKRTGQLEAAGGLAYIAQLVEETPSAANIRAYGRIVRERAMLRQLIEIGGDIAASAHDHEGRGVEELVDIAEQRVFEIADRGQRRGRGFRPLKQILPETIDRLDVLSQNEGDITGISTGFADMDQKTAGLQRGELIIIAGRPSMGKTTCAMNLAENAAIGAQVPTAIFSMEMSCEQLAFRMIGSIGRVNQSRLRTGKLSEEDWSRIDSAVSMMSNAPIFIDDSAGLTPTEVRARARRLKREHGLGLIVIDYLQLMQVTGTTENRATEISEISRSLKALAKELEVPVIALSQLNRSVEQRADKKPVMSDLRECVTGDTLVLLADGRRVPIAALVGGQAEVWAVDEQRRIARAKAAKVWPVGRRQVYRVELASGRSIRATAEHRLLGAAGWVAVGELEPGARLAVARKVPTPAEPKSWPEHALVLLGQLVGDGSYLRGQPLRYTTASEENSAAVTSAAEAFGSTVSRHPGRGRWHQLVIGSNGNRWRPAGVGAWLKELGIFGQRSHEKRLPDEVFELSDEQIALLLRHLWATDGSVSLRKPGSRGAARVYFATSSQGLASDVMALLLRLGILSRLRVVHTERGRPTYNVDVSGVEQQARFVETVGGFGPRVAAVAALAGHLAGLRGTSYGGASHFSFAPSRAIVSQYAELLEDPELASWAASDLFWDRVTAVVDEGEDEVFDMTVPGCANWLADGIVSHNSGAIEQDADLIVFIYREEVYEPDTPRKGVADIIIGKQRNGPIGEFHLTFLGEFTKFENLVADAYGEGVF